MTAKEKAIDLKFKFWRSVDIFAEESKQCALIAVDEMIVQNGELYLLGIAKDYYLKKNAYLFEVKTELEKL